MVGLINWLSQISAVTRFSLRTVPERKGSAAAAVFGIAGVVAVFVGVLSIAQGIRQTMVISAAPEGAIVLRSGADTEMMSGLSRETTKIISEAPGVARDAEGPLASAELFVILNLPKRATGTDANVPMRGVEKAAMRVRDGFRILPGGRMFEWGRNEVIVGRAAAREFAGLDVGGSLDVGREQWRVVGIFTTNGDVSESEIWTDAKVLQPAYRRGDSFQSAHVRLTSAGSFQEFKDALTSDPRLDVKVVRQADFYAEQSTVLIGLVTGLGTLIAAMMGIGAIFGALNTMYTAVAERTREIATLRALGFRSGPVIGSVLFEALLLALVGGLIGGGLAYLAFDGFRAATINWQSFSQVGFAFAVTPGLLIQGAVYSALIGLVGGLFPAIRAARLPVATALREL
jgi:putative ABC transport system permease protein